MHDGGMSDKNLTVVDQDGNLVIEIGKQAGPEEIEALARRMAPQAMMRAFDIILNSKKDSDALKAIDLVLNRGFGKKGITTKRTETYTEVDMMSRAERIEKLEEALEAEREAAAEEMMDE